MALLISSFALVVVLALTTLSSLNINIMRSQIEYAQSLLTAQAAISQIVYEQDSCEIISNEDRILSSFTETYDIKARLNNYPVFYGTRCEFPAKVGITFDNAKQYYSTDNSLSEIIAKGWSDKGNNTFSVPPFSLDLIVNLKIGGSVRHFEALVNRIWSYAAFCENNTITITSPQSNKGIGGQYFPSQIQGNVFSPSQIFLGLPQSQDQGNIVFGDLCTSAAKTDIFEPILIKQGNMIKGHKRYNIPISKHCNLSLSSISFPDKKQFKELNYKELPQIQLVGMMGESTLSLEGDSFAWSGSEETINNNKRILSSYLSMALNNFESLPNEIKLYIQDYIKNCQLSISNEQLIINAMTMYVNDKICGNSFFLVSDLVLEGVGDCNKFYFKGNLSNHFARYIKNSHTKTLNNEFSILNDAVKLQDRDNDVWECCQEKFSKAGLVLKNCTLYIDGDVELLENNNEVSLNDVNTGLSIEGTNATLIVSGNLKLMGGKLESKDKGMVMFAKNIEFSTSGDFKGLILAKGTILINRSKMFSSLGYDSNLKIRGAIACSGAYSRGNAETSEDTVSNGMILKGINIVFDSKYTKSLHQYGKSVVVLFKELQ
jgi:hypothetical protein